MPEIDKNKNSETKITELMKEISDLVLSHLKIETCLV